VNGWSGFCAAGGAAQPPNGSCYDPVSFLRWESSSIPDLFFIDSTTHDFFYPEHVHDALEILWVRSGRAQVRCGGRRYCMQGGDAVVLAPNEVHAGGACGRAHFRFATLHVPRRLLPLLLDLPDGGEAGRVSLPPAQMLSGAAAERLYRRASALRETVSAGDQVDCLRDAMRIVSGRRRPPLREEHPAVRHVRAIIHREFAGPLDIATLASEVGLHERYLISLFRAEVGIPPHQYQIAQRVDYGRRLLGKEISLGTVACTAGFADQSHFNRLFKRIYSMTPGAFRDHTIPILRPDDQRLAPSAPG
jgi:AraC-like DNA-binding protein